jgi:hypothetical protein
MEAGRGRIGRTEGDGPGSDEFVAVISRMNPETREFRASAHRWFGALVAVQAAHSVEESVFGLYDLLPYIRWMDDVFEGGAFTLFVTLNTLFVLFGAWAYLARVRPGAPTAGLFVMLFVVIETLNGILHPAWSLLAGAYIPGTATAPLLLVVSLMLLRSWKGAEPVRSMPA